MKDDLFYIRHRIAEVERTCGRLRGELIFWRTASVIGTAVLLMVTGPHPAVTDNAESTVKAPFRVVDAGGKTLLAVESQENAALVRVMGPDGTPTAEISNSPSGGDFTVKSKNGLPAAELRAHAKGGVVTVYDDRVHEMGILTNGEAGGHLLLRYPGPRDGVNIECTPEGVDMDVNSRSGKSALWLRSRENGGSVTYFDAQGQLRLLRSPLGQ